MQLRLLPQVSPVAHPDTNSEGTGTLLSKVPHTFFTTVPRDRMHGTRWFYSVALIQGFVGSSFAFGHATPTEYMLGSCSVPHLLAFP